MREIKFRAWDKEEGMLYLDEVLHKADRWFSSHRCGVEVELAFTQKFPQGEYREDPEITDWNSLEWMQYTGLKDKHGTEIYEGDIVNIALWDGNDWEWEEGVIKWYEPSSAFKWFSLEEDPSDANNYWLSQADGQQRQVIGNIYENPELLEATS